MYCGIGSWNPGVVIGTRFLSAEMTCMPGFSRDTIFEAYDGGQTTARSTGFDEIWGQFLAKTYDNRCLRNRVYEQYESGIGINETRACAYWCHG